MNSTKKTINTNYIDGVLAQRNYIVNGRATNANTLNWNTYADTAGVAPIDGSGGSPTVTISTSSTSPLSGDNSFTLVKTGVNSQGNGWSTDFTIDACDQAKVLQVQFDYILSSGTFSAGSSSTDSDVTIWLYDVTNSVVIQPSTFRLYSNSSTTPTMFIGNFQTASNSTSYRLILHVGSTSASAYTLKIDNVSVSPTQYVYGTPITDWQQYTVSITATTTNPTKGGTILYDQGFYRRIGDSVQVRYTYRQSSAGTAGSGSYLFSLPSSLTPDAAKIATTPGSGRPYTVGTAAVQGTTVGISAMLNVSGTPRLGIYFPSTGGFLGGGSADDLANSNAQYGIDAIIPIQGWSSAVQMSDQTDGRQTVLQVTKSGGNQTSSGSDQIISSWSTATVDTHSAFNSSSGVYTVPVSGNYSISGAVVMANDTNGIVVKLYKNGSKYAMLGKSGTAGTLVSAYSTIVPCVAGDTLQINVNQSSGGSLAYGSTANELTSLNISRIASPSIVSATDTVAASYWLSANSTTSTQINFDSKEFDTHGAVTTGASWKFTAPVAGYYNLNIGVLATVSASFTLYKNGSSYKYVKYAEVTTDASNPTGMLIKLNAGDYIDIRPDASRTVTGGTLTGTNTSRIDIHLVK